ncbi:MAG TPA: FAD-binding protein [Acidobacteria bacterium]|nr:FAD-binding protein [Acidobacteriota bacterium]
MEMLLTTVGFFLVTGLCVYVYLQRSGPGGAAEAVVQGPPCPRCSAPVPRTAAFCPACGVPRQIYEVVEAREASGEANDEEEGSLHAVVRADLCVGCGTCVAACPEPGAILLEGKLAVVDLAVCKGHGDCAEACPVGGILMTRGEAVQRVVVPDTGPSFESNVPGIYVVGELGGRGLIKNAINEGKIAVEAISRELAATEGEGKGADDVLDLVIVGSGPAGLSAALEAARAKLRYVVLEQGTLADTIRKYPRRKLLLGEPIKIPLYGDLWIADTTKETLLEVWGSIIESVEIDLRTHHRVETISRLDDHYSVHAAGQHFLARRVVLALGRRGTPRRLGVPGEDGDNVFYDIVEMEAFAGRRVLVVGGGDSAIESALGLANQESTTVALSYRGQAFARARKRNQERIAAAAAAGKVELLLGTHVKEIRPDNVAIEQAGEIVVRPNDDVIIRIGGSPPFDVLEKIGVRMVTKDVPLAGVKDAVGA